MSVFFRGLVMPKNCVECEWRDVEAGGECELMISNPFLSFEEQYSHCPFNMIQKRYPIIFVPVPHGRLKDENKIVDSFDPSDFWNSDAEDNCFAAIHVVNCAPTVIEAEEGE